MPWATAAVVALLCLPFATPAQPAGLEVEWVLGGLGASCTEACAEHPGFGSVGCHGESFNITRDDFDRILERITVGPADGICSSVAEGGACFDPSYDGGQCGWRGCPVLAATAHCASVPASTARRFCPCGMRAGPAQADVTPLSPSAPTSVTTETLATTSSTAPATSRDEESDAAAEEEYTDELRRSMMAEVDAASPVISTSPVEPAGTNAMSDQQKQQMIGGIVGGTLGVVTVGLLGGLLGGLLTTSTTGAPMLPRTTTVPTTTSSLAPVFEERMLGGPHGSLSAWGSWVGSGASDLTESVRLGAHGQDALVGGSARTWWIVAGLALVCCVAVVVLLSLGVDRAKGRRDRRREGRGVAMSEASDAEQSWPASPAADDSAVGSPTAETALLEEGDVPEVRFLEGAGAAGPRVARLKCLPRPWGLPKLQPLGAQRAAGPPSPEQSMFILSPSRVSLQGSRCSMHSAAPSQYALAPQRLSSGSPGQLPHAPRHHASGSELATVRSFASVPGVRSGASLPGGAPRRAAARAAHAPGSPPPRGQRGYHTSPPTPASPPPRGPHHHHYHASP